MRSIILFELNEVPFKVIDFFCDKNPQSTLANLLPKCYQYNTFTPDQGHLHPWSTWPTFHRGVSNHLHKIKDLGEDLTLRDQKYPPIWKILTQNDIRTGIFTSMNTFPIPDNPKNYEFYVPDMFAKDSQCLPQEAEAFQEFCLSMTRRSVRNVDSSIDLKAALHLLSKLPGLGVKMRTINQIGLQLLGEKISHWKTTRRRTFQAVLSFDIFMKLLEQRKPQFATFLSNHVAATMHRYWAATFPQDYDNMDLNRGWVKTYKEEINFAMSKFDSFLDRLVKFVHQNKQYLIVVASSMGQKATRAKSIQSELTLKDPGKLLSAMGIQVHAWEQLPTMHPQFNLKIKPEFENVLMAGLGSIEIDGKPLVFRRKDGIFFSIDLGHINLKDKAIKFNQNVIDAEFLGLENIKPDESASGTAYHVPQGCMFIYDAHNGNVENKRPEIETTAFVPSILENFKIPVPDYMTKQRIACLR
ncbi:MAG: hypothetical protein ACR2MX_18150 [Cyclobacteriaceae bacterium]